MTTRLDRRLFLRGLGGAIVAAPFVRSFHERAARAQAVPVDAPRRWIAMFTHYGCLTDRWFPLNSHGPLTAADLEGTTLEVLAPHVNKLLMPRGIAAMNQWTSALTRGQGNDPHLQVCGTYFTGVPVTPNSDDPFSFEAATKFEAMPTARSLDHVCSEQLQPGKPPLLLNVAGISDTPISAVSYSADATLFAGINSAADAFASLTGLLAPGAEMSPDTYRALRGQSVIDLVRTDLDALEGHDMSLADRHQLEAWKELLHQTGVAVASRFCSEDSVASLGLVSTNLAAAGAPDENSDAVTMQVGAGLDAADLFSNLAVLTALCDANRVILLKYPANFVFRGLGLSADSHALSHRILNANMQGNCASNINEQLQSIDAYYAAKFAHLIEQLDSFDEGDGTLLDSTATIWFQEMSDGNAHNLNNLPLLQAGSCGGYFKTGQAVNVEDGSSDLTRGYSTIVCDPSASQADILSSGTPVEFANAPINKYLCNLMNALGVKAGPDGFPLAGGDAEVTHWGMYDRTEDFVGGGTNPPRINDPGEFADLKA